MYRISYDGTLYKSLINFCKHNGLNVQNARTCFNNEMTPAEVIEIYQRKDRKVKFRGKEYSSMAALDRTFDLSPRILSEQRMTLLLSLCRFDSYTQHAMLRYFTQGRALGRLASTFNIQQPNLVSSIARVQGVYETIIKFSKRKGLDIDKVRVSRNTLRIKMQPGTECEQHITLLLSLCRLNDNTQQAMLRYFVNGWTLDLLAYTFNIEKPNLVRCITKVQEVYDTIQKINTH